MYAELMIDQSIETWLGCHRRAIEHFNGVPAVCLIDNLKAASPKRAIAICKYTTPTPTVRKVMVL